MGVLRLNTGIYLVLIIIDLPCMVGYSQLTIGHRGRVYVTDGT